jgi:peptide/nickel transport system substrate-binding protein
MSVVAVGCGSSSNSTAKSTSTSGHDTLVWAKSFDVESLDPAHQHEVTGQIVDTVMYDRLMQFKGSEETPTPMAAESYEASEDQRTFTFHLRDGIKFSDGTPLTSKDVVFSFNRVTNLKSAPAYLTEGFKSVSAPDPKTVVIKTKDPMPGVPALVTGANFSILNSKVVGEHGGTDAENANKKDSAQSFLDTTSAGSGPYVLDAYDRRARITLKANPDYWGGTPGFKQIVLKNVPTENQLLEVQKGTAQLAVDLSPTQIANVRPGDLQIKRRPSITFFFLVANADPKVSPVAANKKFQEAVRYGLDYQNIVQLVGEGAAQSPGVVPAGIEGALPASEAPKRDIARAKAALASSGIANPTVKLEYPSDFTLNGLQFGTIAQRIQSQLGEVGIKVKLTPGPLATTLENWRGGKEELGLWTTTPDYPAPYTYLDFCPGHLQSLRINWKEGADPELTEPCKQGAQIAVDDKEQLDSVYATVQHRLNEAGPFFPLFQPAQVAVAASWVKGIEFSATTFVDLAQLKHD